MKSPTAAVILIGNELLSGRTEDANLNYIARRMTDVGIQLQEARVIRDEIDIIVETLNELRTKYSYVFTTGGIGPTHDDITVRSVAKAFDLKIERNDRVATDIRLTLGNKFTEASLKMADFPVGARLIHNNKSSAPGFNIGNVYVMAGIPNYMQVMLEACIPLLEQGDPIYSKSIDVLAGEGMLSGAFGDVQNKYPLLELGSYPFKHGENNATSLVVRGTDSGLVDKAFADITHMLEELGVNVRS